MKKINWKVRFKNRVWLTSFFSLIIGFVFSMLKLFDVEIPYVQDTIMDIVERVLIFLGLFGVVADPTTNGLYDSQRALGYDMPWVDYETEEHTEDPKEEINE